MQGYSIDRSLNGSTVLLTGVTGFIGGALLERILSLEPGPDKVFVLVRKKRGLEPRCRFNAIASSPLFSELDSRLLKKVDVIPGDVTIDDLGMSDQNRQLLLSTCTHVFHSAASISFAVPLKSAIRINVLGTRYILHLTKKMPNIKSMVHVSTAYANCTRNSDKHLDERVYPTKFDPIEFTDMISKMSSEEIELRSKEFLGDHANTYTFTKCMAENLLKAERGNVPLSIVRPSIVLNSLNRPFVGWVDNVNNGACGFIAGIGRGIFRTFQANPNGRLDIVPVDIVVSTILGASIRATENPEKLPIFHCTADYDNSTSWTEYCEAIVKYSRLHPCKFFVWYPIARPRRSYLRNMAVIYIFHLLPAYIFTLFWQFRRPGRRHILLAVQQKFSKADAHTGFFGIRQWSFSRENVIKLQNELAKNERESHPMNPSDINWDRYFEICVLGLRRYFHKEGSTTTDRARLFMKRMRIIAAVTPSLSFVLFWYILAIFLPGTMSTIVAPLIAGFLILFLMWL